MLMRDKKRNSRRVKERFCILSNLCQICKCYTHFLLHQIDNDWEKGENRAESDPTYAVRMQKDYLVISSVVNLRPVFIRYFQTTTVSAFPVNHRLRIGLHLAFQHRRILVSYENYLVAYTNKRRNWNARSIISFVSTCMYLFRFK